MDRARGSAQRTLGQPLRSDGDARPSAAQRAAPASAPGYSSVMVGELIAIGARRRPGRRHHRGHAHRHRRSRASARRSPTRLYDVGIAEQHAMTLATGLALAGQRPVRRAVLDVPPARLRPGRPRRLPERRARSSSASTAPGSSARTARATRACSRSPPCASCRTSSWPHRATSSSCGVSCARPSPRRTRSRSSTRATPAGACAPVDPQPRRDRQRRGAARRGARSSSSGSGRSSSAGREAAQRLRGDGLVGRRSSTRASCRPLDVGPARSRRRRGKRLVVTLEESALRAASARPCWRCSRQAACERRRGRPHPATTRGSRLGRRTSCASACPTGASSTTARSSDLRALIGLDVAGHRPPDPRAPIAGRGPRARPTRVRRVTHRTRHAQARRGRPPERHAAPECASTSCWSTAGWPRRASRAQALLLAGSVRVGQRRRRPPRPAAGRPGRPDDRARRWTGRRDSSRGAARSSRARSTRSASTPRAASASTWAPRPAASPTVCCSAARAASMLSTWVEDSWPRRSGTTRASSAWSAPTRSRLDPSAEDPVTLPERVSLAVADVVVHLAHPGPAAASPHWVAPGGAIVPMVKPQFELEPARRPARRRARSGAPRRRGRARPGPCRRASASPAWPRSSRRSSGPSGNHEFFLHLRVAGAARAMSDRTCARDAPRVRVQPHAGAGRRSCATGRWLVRGPRHRRMGRARRATPGEQPERVAASDAVVVLGGDGTFLRAARAVAETGRADPGHQQRQGRLPLQGRARPTGGRARRSWWPATTSIEERMALEARVSTARRRAMRPRRTSRSTRPPSCAAARARVVRLEVARRRVAARDLHLRRPRRRDAHRLDRLQLQRRRARSSTRRSRNLVVTPIAAYLTPLRSSVVSPRHVVRVRVEEAFDCLVSIDGREDIPLEVGRRGRGVARATLPSASSSREARCPFWDLLREKAELLPR